MSQVKIVIKEFSKFLLMLFDIIDKNARFDEINNLLFSGL